MEKEKFKKDERLMEIKVSFLIECAKLSSLKSEM